MLFSGSRESSILSTSTLMSTSACSGNGLSREPCGGESLISGDWELREWLFPQKRFCDKFFPLPLLHHPPPQMLLYCYCSVEYLNICTSTKQISSYRVRIMAQKRVLFLGLGELTWGVNLGEGLFIESLCFYCLDLLFLLSL